MFFGERPSTVGVAAKSGNIEEIYGPFCNVSSLRIATIVGGLMLVGVPLASAAARPASPDARSALRTASPDIGLPIIGGLVGSMVGIVTDTVFGGADAVHAVACSVSPFCPPAPAHARIRR
jgi:hypothetical protein